jgi:hypothetical protein
MRTSYSVAAEILWTGGIAALPQRDATALDIKSMIQARDSE